MHVHIRKLAVALALVAGCTSTGSQSRETTASTGEARDSSQASTGTQPSERRAGAEDPLMEPGPAIKGHAEDKVVSGQVGQVSAFSVVVQSDQGELKRLEIAPETSITVNGRDASYAELREGQPVRASYAEVEGHEVAVEIQAQGTGPSGSSGMEAPSLGTGSGVGSGGVTEPDSTDTGGSESGSSGADASEPAQPGGTGSGTESAPPQHDPGMTR